MKNTNSLVCVICVDENGDLDFGCGNHGDVDLCVSESLEHIGSNAGVAFHTGTYDGNLCNRVIKKNLSTVVLVYVVVLEDFNSLLAVVLGNCECDVLCVVSADGLENDVNVDVLCRKK